MLYFYIDFLFDHLHFINIRNGTPYTLHLCSTRRDAQNSGTEVRQVLSPVSRALQGGGVTGQGHRSHPGRVSLTQCSPIAPVLS